MVDCREGRCAREVVSADLQVGRANHSASRPPATGAVFQNEGRGEGFGVKEGQRQGRKIGVPK